MILALALAFQIVAGRAYTTSYDGQLYLATSAGRMAITLGQGCENVSPWQDVFYLPGSHGVASLQPVDSDDVCNISVDAYVNTWPCLTDASRECEASLEQP